MNFIDKLLGAKDKYKDPQDAEVIDGWIATAKRALLINSLKDNKGMQIVLAGLKDEVAKINIRLLEADSSTMPDRERDRLLDKRDLYSGFLSIFSGAEADIENIKRETDEALV